MDSQSLQTLFPNGTVESVYRETKTHLVIPLDSGYFYLNKDDLSPREIVLITELLINKQPKKQENHHVWYNILFNHGELPSTPKHYRIIQMNLRKNTSNKDSWLAHFSSLFDCVVDSFFVDDTTAIIVEEQTSIFYSKEDIKSMILTLEAEFLIQATIFVGKYQAISHDFIDCFNEETTIFKLYNTSFHANDVFEFQDVALKYLTKKAIKDSPLMTSLYNTTNFDEETIRMIKTLWQEQGNITSSAKKLYTHRNTLQYKLDKFSEQIGISLKNMTDLTLYYLLILSL